MSRHHTIKAGSPGSHPGFTLVEMIIVIGIIGVIASVVIAAISPRRGLLAARDVQRSLAAREIRNAVMQYQISNNGLLPAADEIPQSGQAAKQICAFGVTGNADCVNLDVLVTEYLAELPRDIVEPCVDFTGYTIRQKSVFIEVEALHKGMMPGDAVTVSPGCPSETAWVPSASPTSSFATGNMTIGLAVGDTLYVAGYQNAVKVIDAATDTLTATVQDGGGYPGYAYHMASLGNKLYVGSNWGNTLTVIDRTTNTVSKNVSVAPYPYDLILVGSKLYVVTFNTVAVIDTATDTVLTTISYTGNSNTSFGATSNGLSPARIVTAVGTKVYVLGNGNVSVIDTATDTVSSTITNVTEWSGGNADIVSVGTKVYVTHGNAPMGGVVNKVSVIDTATDTVTEEISVGSNPRYIGVHGSKLYVTHANSPGTISVIDTADNDLLTTIPVGNYPRAAHAIGQKVYVSNYFSGTVSVIDPASDAVTDTITVSMGYPMGVFLAGGKGYVVSWYGVEGH